MCSNSRDISLLESVEYVGQEIFTDPLAGVSHNDLDVGICAARMNLDTPMLRSKFDRIGQQVPDHLLQSFRVCRHCRRCGFEVDHKVDLFRFGRGTDYFQSSGDDLRRVYLADSSRSLPETIRATSSRSSISWH